MTAQPKLPGGTFTVVSRPGPRTRDAIVAAAATMALADGRVEQSERRGLLVFLKQNHMLLALGREDINQRFAQEVGRAVNLATDHQDVLSRLRPLAGTEAARLVATAAAYVAAADGIIHPTESELLQSLREALGLAESGDAVQP
jgi:tellurite resistance protein